MKRVLSFMLAAVMSFSIIAADIPAGAEESRQSETQASTETELEGTNTFADLLTQEIDEETANQLEGNGYNIVSVEVDTSTNEALVEFSALKCCTLVVAAYNEDGTQLVASGSKEVNQFDMETVVNIEGTLPQYFYLKAYLVEETTLRPLSVVYESPNYTKTMQDFFAKTTDDFDQERVLNLDDDKTNNFGVYNENVIVIPEAEGVNTVKTSDDANGLYVIVNADENFTSLKSGDLFAYEYGVNDIILAKVGTISVDGTTVTITGTETSLKEFFEYLRIDEEGDMQNAVIDDSTCDEGITYEGLVADMDESDETENSTQKSIAQNKAYAQPYAWEGDVKSSYSESYKLSIFDKRDFAEVSISGKLESKNEVGLKFYIAWTYQYIELKLSHTLQWTIAVTGKIKGEWTLAKAEIPLGTTGINVIIKPKIIVEASAEINYSGKVTKTLGFAYDSDTGFSDLSSGPKTDSSCKIQGTLFVGVEIEIGLTVLNEGIAKASLKPRFGIEFKAAIAQKGVGNPSSSERHSCTSGNGAGCYDGDISLKSRVNAELVLLGFIKLEHTIAEKTLKFADFYYSIQYDEFGMGNCPHKDYLVEVKVKDENGKAISNAKVTTGAAEEGTKNTDQNGVAAFYLPKGYYNISAEKVNYQTESDGITVGNAKKSIELVLGAKDYKMTINVKDENGKAVSGLNVTAVMVKDKNGRQVTSAKQQVVKTNALGTAVFDVSSGTYSVSATDRTKGSASKNVYVYGKDKSETLTLSKAVQNVTVLDSDGNAIPDASVSIKMLTDENGTAVPNGDEIIVSTDSDGKAELAVGNGTYRVTAKKTGYKSASKSITVKDNSNDIEFTLSKSSNGTLKDIVKVSAGGYHYAAIDKNGDLWMWGNNSYGQLGDGSTTRSDVPVKVLENVEDVSLGNYHSGAVTKDGSLYMWGRNNVGQLGDGSYTNSSVPIKILDNVKSVKLGNFYEGTASCAHSAAITNDGQLYLWGNNDYGQLGDGTSISRITPFNLMGGVIDAAVDDWHSAAITSDGSLYTWGNNFWGQLGNGKSGGSGSYDDGIDSDVPVKILDNVINVSYDGWTGAAVTAGGELYLWGNSNTLNNTNTPQVYLNGIRYVSIGGLNHTQFGAAITTDGSLTTFGSGYKNTDILSDVADVSCGGTTGLAVTEDGTLYTWNGSSQPQVFSVSDTEDQNSTLSINQSSTKSADLQSAGSVSDTGNAVRESRSSVRGIASAETQAVSAAKTAEFTDLVPGEVYNVYLVRTRVLADPCGSGNLLYINQVTADGEGKITLNYIPKAEYITTELFAVGADCSQHSYENGECIYCGAVCEHSFDESDVCTVCGAENTGILGDCNLNGVVNLYDVIEIAKFIMDMRTFNEKEMLLSDCNLDTNVNLYDAVEIARWIMNPA